MPITVTHQILNSAASATTRHSLLKLKSASPYLAGAHDEFPKSHRHCHRNVIEENVAPAKAGFRCVAQDGPLGFIKTYTNGRITPTPTMRYVKKEMNTEPNTNFVVEADGNIEFLGKPGDTDVSLSLTNAGWLSAIRVQLVPDKKLTTTTKKGRTKDDNHLLQCGRRR